MGVHFFQPTSVELPGGKSGRGSENKVPFIAAVQTTETGDPLFVCLTKLEFTKDAIVQWAKKSLCASVTDHMTMLEQNPERVRRYFGDPKVAYAAS